jgi:hypothetical protein
MTRTADYTIQGFLYQFNKTILEILSSTQDESQITVEGIVEDIDITTPLGDKAIQCKYHEATEKFTLSGIYKPVLQMMKHFREHPNLNIEYRLYAYFQGCAVGNQEITVDQLRQVTESKNQRYRESFHEVFEQGVDLQEFSRRFVLEFGKPLDELRDDVYEALSNSSLPQDNTETLLYPNALQRIVDLSVKHHEDDRKITKLEFLNHLRDVRTTAVTRWTLALKTAKKILETRKEQLKPNLDKNSRLRYFLISESSLEDFDTGIVTFIDEYLDKYHFKTAHDQTPLFCLDCTQEKFADICVRAHLKGISFTDGLRGSRFFEDFFFREPVCRSVKSGENEREFLVRLLQFDPENVVLNERKCDDLFIVSQKDYTGIDSQDVNIEVLAVTSLQGLRFVLGVSNAYD